MGGSVDLNVKLEAAVRREDDVWIAWSPSLDVVTQGETRQAARDALKEAVQLWFESCIERGALDGALQEAGFDRTKPGEHAVESSAAKDYIEVSIPVSARHSQTELVRPAIPKKRG